MARGFSRGAQPLATSLCSFLAVALASCSPPAGGSDDQTGSSSHPALAACERPDVQEVVGKETRSKLFKTALPGLMLQEWLGVDSRRAIADFDNAVVTFDHIALDHPEALGEAPYQQIVCTGHVQIDMSNATAGQQIIGIDGLRWVVNISGQPTDSATDAFTVDVDDVSIQRGLTINGRAPAQQQPGQAEENASRGGDAGTAVAPSAEDEAAREAAQAAAAGDAAAAQAQGLSEPAPQSPAQPRPNNNPPSEEDLYAPH